MRTTSSRARQSLIESLEPRRLMTYGALDTSFSGDGLSNFFQLNAPESTAIAVQANGKTVVAGKVGDNLGLVRFNFDGTLDTTFGAAHNGQVQTHIGSAALSTAAYSMVIQTDGKIVLGGRTNGQTVVFRYTSAGVLDTSYSGDGLAIVPFSGEVRALALQKDGKVVAVGSDLNGSNADFALARLNTNGSLDTTFGTSGKTVAGFGAYEYANAVAIDYQGTLATNPQYGKIVVVGNMGASNIAVARFLSTGKIDTSFSGDGKVIHAGTTSSKFQGYAVLLQPNGKIVAVGDFLHSTNPDHQFFSVRFTSTGVKDTTFGTNGTATADVSGSGIAKAAVTTRSGGFVLAGGADERLAFAAFNANGIADTTFGVNGKNLHTLEDGGGAAMAYGPGRRFVAVSRRFRAARLLDTGANEVSVVTLSQTAAEAGNVPVSGVVSRTETLPVATRVYFTLTGTATPPTFLATGPLGNGPNIGDYNLTGMISSTAGWYVDILPNQLTAKFTLTPINDTKSEGPETVRFTIASNASYVVANPATATASIADDDVTPNSITSVADATVRDTSPTTNFGTASALEAKNTSTQHSEAYLKFDISALSGFNTAKLRLFGNMSATGLAIKSTVYATNDVAWLENGLTWNNRTQSNSTLQTISIVDATPKWYEWDITTYVREAKLANKQFITLIVTAAPAFLRGSSTYLSFNSIQSKLNKPTIVTA